VSQIRSDNDKGLWLDKLVFWSLRVYVCV